MVDASKGANRAMGAGQNINRPLLAAVVATCLSAVLFVALFNIGVGQSWDSNFYLLFSQQIRLNGSTSLGEGLYAPAYPVTLALLTIAGLSTEAAMSLVNAAAVGALFLAGWRVIPTSPPLTRMLLGGLVVGVALTSESFFFAWSEPLFTAMLAFAVSEAMRCFDDRNVSPTLLALLLVLPLSRYIGLVSSVALLGVMALRFYPTTARPENGRMMLRVLAAAIVAVAPLLAVGVWNHLSYGCALGCRVPSETGAAENVVLLGKALWRDRLVLAPIAISIVALAVLARRDRARLVIALIPVAVAGLSFAAQVASSSLVSIDPIDGRFVSPYYPLLVLSLAALIGGMGDRRRIINALLSLLIVCQFAVAGNRLADMLARTANTGSITDVGYKLTPAFAQVKAHTRANSVVSFFPETEGYGNLSAYLLLNSAYWERCRPTALNDDKREASVELRCADSRPRNGLAMSVPRDLPEDAEVLFVDKARLDGSSARAAKEMASRRALEVVLETEAFTLYAGAP